ncbi:conserved hypothetical protein [Parafrankia sp. EAN1pec]|uniref:hypothetical protein n=1 Tax=Parafrankia sp. (strain EAN1pec) TaxID=298653 RepID=UPI0000543019|nr:conserved hypothetical protein [Frankia sp. EAN1pec]
MATIYKTVDLDISSDAAWAFVEKFVRSEVHVFSNSASERQDGNYRVVTDHEGAEFWELNVGIDAEHRYSSYTVPDLFGATFHAASMQILDNGGPGCRFVWITDVLPDSFAEDLRGFYDNLFAELVAAIKGSSA